MKRSIMYLGLAGMLTVPATVLALAPLGVLRNTQTAEVVYEAQIARLPVTYAWAVDALDIDTLMTIFSEDIEYDLSAYNIPNAKGKDAVRNIFLKAVFPINRCSFITISNIWSEVTGNSGEGGDYFVHVGIDPVVKPPLPENTRRVTEGRHFYRFKKEADGWKISYLRGDPFHQAVGTYDPALLFNCPMAPGK